MLALALAAKFPAAARREPGRCRADREALELEAVLQETVATLATLLILRLSRHFRCLIHHPRRAARFRRPCSTDYDHGRELLVVLHWLE